MKSLLSFLPLLFVVSCATKYILPGNRFMTPETQGGALRGEFSIGQTNANQLAINTKNGSVEDGLVYEDSARLNYQYAQSLFDPLDIYVNHTASANSMLGVKFQVFGASKVSKGTGHKIAIAAGVGENEYETDDKSIEFNLGGTEYLAIYGYRFNETILAYSNLSYSNYSFEGTVKRGTFAGRKPEYDSRITGLSVGGELTYGMLVSKLECLYQKIDTTDTNARARFILGYSFGIAW